MTTHPDEYPVSAVRLFALLQLWTANLQVIKDCRERLRSESNPTGPIVISALDMGVMAMEEVLVDLRTLLIASIPPIGYGRN